MYLLLSHTRKYQNSQATMDQSKIDSTILDGSILTLVSVTLEYLQCFGLPTVPCHYVFLCVFCTSYFYLYFVNASVDRLPRQQML